MTHIQGNPKTGLFGATLGFFFGFASVALFGPTARQFEDLLQLSPEQVGLLVAVPALTGSLLRIPFAAWVDTTGGRKPFMVLLGLSLAGMLGLTLVVNVLYPAHMTPALYPLLLVLGMLCGCGIATFSVGIGQVSYWFTMDQQGKALGIYAGVGNLAPGIFSFLLPVALSTLGLGGSYLTWLLFLGVGAFLYYRYSRNAPYFQLLEQGVSENEARDTAREQGQQLFPAGTLKDSLVVSAKTWRTWLLVAMYFTTFGGFIAMTAWLPIYWTSYLAAGAVTAGLLTALYSVLASTIRIWGGGLADVAGGENTAIGSLLVMLLGALLMSISSGIGLSVTAVVLMALGMGVGNAAIFKLVPQEIPEAVGGAAGWVGGLGAFGGFVIPPILGTIVRRTGDTGYASGFFVFVALAGLSLGLASVLKILRKEPAHRHSKD